MTALNLPTTPHDSWSRLVPSIVRAQQTAIKYNCQFALPYQTTTGTMAEVLAIVASALAVAQVASRVADSIIKLK
jgi:hypothetical protein